MKTGRPIEQATVSIFNKQANTNHQGLCTIEQSLSESEHTPDNILIIEKDGDVCMLTNIYSYGFSTDEYKWHVFNDRGLYKPKEEVHLKGYLRFLKVKGDSKVPGYAQGFLKAEILDPRGERLHQLQVKLNDYGAFDISFMLPDNANLGNDSYVRQLQ